jgi:NADH-quinone oxidoreductase subunit L
VEHIHDAPLIVIVALCPLVVGSLWSGYLGQYMFLGMGTPFWGNSLFFGWTTTLGLEPHFLPLATKFLPLIFTCLGGFLAFLAFVCLSNITFTLTFHPWIKPIFTFLNKKWYFDKIYDEVFLIQTILFGRNVTYRLLDGFIFESLGPVGVQSTVGTLSGSHRNFQNGFLPNYTSLFFFGVWIFLVGFVALPKCLHLFPGLEVFLVTASLGLPALLGVFLWDCTLSASQS